VYVGAKSAGLYKKKQCCTTTKRTTTSISLVKRESNTIATRTFVLVPHFTGVLLELLPDPPHLRKRRRALLFAFLGLVQSQQQRQQTSVSVFKSNKQTNKQTFLRKRQNNKTYLVDFGRQDLVHVAAQTSFQGPHSTGQVFVLHSHAFPCLYIVVGRKKHRLKEVN